MNVRPLVLRFGAVGDTVLLTSLLSVLHRRWAAPIDVIVRNESSAKVLAGLPEVGDVKVIGSRRAPYLLAPGQQRFVSWLRARGPGPAWVIDPVPRVTNLLERGGIGISMQVRELDHPWSTDPVVHHHDWLLYMASLDPPGVAPRPPACGPPPRPHLVVDPAERADCDRWLHRLGLAGTSVVVVQTEARRRKRGRWPAERWAHVLREIVARVPEAHVLVSGKSSEKTAARAVVEVVGHPRVRSVAGDLPLRRLIALLDRAHSCLSLDSGPAHIAAAVGCPVTVVVGPVHPGLYRPVGLPGRVEVVSGIPPEEWPSDQLTFRRTHRVEMVEPEAVLAAWERMNVRMDRERHSSGS